MAGADLQSVPVINLNQVSTDYKSALAFLGESAPAICEKDNPGKGRRLFPGYQGEAVRTTAISNKSKSTKKFSEHLTFDD